MVRLGEISRLRHDCYRLTIGTVDEVMIDTPWSYDSCPYCTTTFDPLKCGSTFHSCQNQVTDTVPRYKLVLKLEQNGEKANFHFWDGTCIKIFGKSVDQCRQELVASDDEVKVFPPYVDELLGKTWAVKFKHCVQMRQSSVLDDEPSIGKGKVVAAETSSQDYHPTTCGSHPTTRRTHVWMVKLTEAMISAPRPLVLPMHALSYLGVSRKNMTVLVNDGHTLLWKLTLHDAENRLQCVAESWYQYLRHNDFSVGDEICLYFREIVSTMDSIQLSVKEAKHLCLSEIENLLQGNKKSLQDFSSMPYPIGYVANTHGNKLIFNEMAYDKELLHAEFNNYYYSVTALPRVQSKKGLHIIIHDKEGTPKYTTINVVYKEVFANL
ncbi:hypothetical protein GmHk_15G045140 [Glycine max]|nr:hypothetical protein GmHk_15G045140 [Glycine max]